eukprot:gnl/Dysnectes_brevis/664_a732_6378.p1 GENE.gnl/Dysnectes_brevis/664_a732_6378~~gnl/Dysnectes_brevis/664_a732_6378.p1  ORF type:complete len:145 (+),score=14.98 gnl/Dysnectes_brevis/664_a732_6378:158-592(+)
MVENKDRVYYMSESTEKQCHAFARKQLHSAGILIGKFTHSKKFHLSITSLPILAQFATYKVWLTAPGELTFLYKNNINKSHIAKLADSMPVNVGVVVCSESNEPIGFGVSAKSTLDSGRSSPHATIIIHQADVGEYLRGQDTLM